MTFLTAGGGGHGDPASRDVTAVKRDVALGYVSEARATHDYVEASAAELHQKREAL